MKSPRSGRPRSLEAFHRTRVHFASKEAVILHVLHPLYPGGLTCDELEQALDMTHQTCSARCSDLRRKVWVEPCGQRSTRSGCDADVLRFVMPEPSAVAEAA